MPYPKGCCTSAGLRERLSAVSRNSSLTVSATECAPSASIDDDPVRAPATILATAMARLAAPATTTVPNELSVSCCAIRWTLPAPRAVKRVTGVFCETDEVRASATRTMKPFLLLGTRGEDPAADSEYAAFLSFTGLDESLLQRVRLERRPLGGLD